MSKTLQQIFATNPITVNLGSDLMYFVESPYTPGTDAGMLFSNFSAQFISSTGIVTPAQGGTGVNNGTHTLTLGGNTAFSGAFTFTGTLTGNTGVTFPTSGTLATTSQLLTSPLTTKGDIWVWSTTNDRQPVAIGDGKILQVSSGAATGLAYSTPTYPSASGISRKVLISDGTNNVYSTETYAVPGTSGNVMTSDGTNWTSAAPAITTVLTTKGDILGFSTVDARIPVGTTNGQVLQVNSANAVGVGYSTPTYPTASGTAGQILRSDGTNNLYTTSTYPNTNAINTLLYASAANVMSALTTANNGLLVTGPTTGTPSILAGPGTTGNFLQSNAAAAPSWSSSTITLGGNFTTSGAFTTTLTVTGATNVTLPTSGTLATTSQLPTLPLSLANGGTNAALVASNGGIFYSTGSAGAILGGTATANQILLSGASTTPAWSTTTYPATNAINTIMYASSANVLGVISAVNGGVLVSNNTGVPSMLANPAAAGKVLQSGNAAIPTWSTPTYPSGSATSGLFIVSDGTNFVASAKAAFTTINIQTFAASGTYTPTTGMKYCIIECVGPGGAGGGAAVSTDSAFGAGGGAGAYSRKFATAATIGSSQTVTVGTGGTPGTAGNNPGGNGSGATSVGAICTAGAGQGGAGAAANTGSGVGGAGGAAGTGDLSVAGNAGSPGMGAAVATVALNGGLGGAGPWGGQAAAAGASATLTGAAGNGPGAGGNGGGSTASSAAKAGGAGANGIVIITEYIYA